MEDVAEEFRHRLAGALRAVLPVCLALCSADSLSQQDAAAAFAEQLPPELHHCIIVEHVRLDPDCVTNMFFLQGAELEAALDSAGVDDTFFVELELDEHVSVARLRALAIQLEIPRMLATPQLIISNGDRRNLPSIGLGTLYEEQDAWLRQICDARTRSVVFGVPESNSRNPGDWPVRNISVTATAYTVKQLIGGGFLPGAELIKALPQQEPFLQGIRNLIARELAPPLSTVVDVPVPPECQPYVQPQGGELLYRAGDSASGITYERGGDNSRFIRALSGTLPDSRLELYIYFENPASIEMLGALVERYAMDSLFTAMYATDNTTLSAVSVQLGPGSDPIEVQLEYVRCQLQLQAQADPAWSGARAPHATIMLGAESVWQLMSDSAIRSILLGAQVSADKLVSAKAMFSSPLAERQRNPLAPPDSCIP